MRVKNTKHIRFEGIKTKSSFSGERLTQYGGRVFVQIHDKINIPYIFDDLFPTVKHNATKFSTTQVLLSFYAQLYVA